MSQTFTDADTKTYNPDVESPSTNTRIIPVIKHGTDAAATLSGAK